MPNAVVYLKNTKTLTVRTYIAQNDGAFRFPELSNNVDYEIYAQRNGKKSDTKVLSQFDDRAQPHINLRIDVNKEPVRYAKVKAAICWRPFQTLCELISCFRCWRASTT